MAKNKRNQRPANKGSLFSQPETKPKEKEEPPKGPPSRVRSGAFCLRSSLGVPFLVVSNTQLVADVPAPSAEDWKELAELASSVMQQWEDRGSAVLADFEGEFMGFGGELLTAAFQRTLSVDTRTMRAIIGLSTPKEMGLLLNVRCPEAAALIRRLMEGERCLKLIWGAEEDVASLHSTLKARVRRVVDAQLAFSGVDHRLGMASMLRRLSPASLAGLPSKTCIDFSAPHAYNRRALHQPLTREEARYAVDDLHRLDAVLRSQKPHNGSYFPAEAQTNVVNSSVLDNPAVFFANKLRYYEEAFRRKHGLQRQLLAVQAKRHLLGGRSIVSEECLEAHKAVESLMDSALQAAGVCVPEDLSFNAQSEGESSSEDAEEAADAKDLGGEPAAGQGEAPSGATKRAGERSGSPRPRKRAKQELADFAVWHEDDTEVYDLWGFVKKEVSTEQGAAVAARAEGGGPAKEEQQEQQGPPLCAAAEGDLGAFGTAVEEVKVQKDAAAAPAIAQETGTEKDGPSASCVAAEQRTAAAAPTAQEKSAGEEEEGQGASLPAPAGGQLVSEQGTAAAVPTAEEKGAGKEEKEEGEGASSCTAAGGVGEEQVAGAANTERTKKAKKKKKVTQTEPGKRAKRRRGEAAAAGAAEPEVDAEVALPGVDAAVAAAATAAAAAASAPSVDAAKSCSVQPTASAAEATADSATPAQPPGTGKRKKKKKATAAGGQ